MPRLQNPRRELFAQTVVRTLKDGGNYTEAYRQSGYAGTGHVAEVGGSRLMSYDEVQLRVGELMAPAARKTGVSVESLLSELEITIQDARAAEQHGVVVRALELAAKLVGLLRERIEVRHEFAGLQTSEEILAMIRAEFGDAAADAIEAALAPGPDVDEAIVINGADCAQLVPSSKLGQ